MAPTTPHNRPFHGPASGDEAWRRENLVFARQRSDRTPLKKIRGMETWTESILGGIGIIAFILLAFAAAGWIAADLESVRAWFGIGQGF